MFGTHDLPVFLVTGIILNLTPGQDTIYIITRSVAHGRGAGILSALGISTGGLIHTLAAAFGLSAILASSAFIFGLVKWAGAAYLVYLGLCMLLRKRRPAREGAPAPPVPARANSWAASRVFRQGVLTNLLNPKVALFFLAFLPQFVDPGSSHKVLSFLFLGALFWFFGTVWCLVVAFIAAALTRLLRENPKSSGIMQGISGAVLVGLGIRLALGQPD